MTDGARAVVAWTDTALAHLAAIHEYLAQTSPLYARRVVDRITRRSVQLGSAPHAGQRVSECERADVYEVAEGPYRLVFRAAPARLEMLAVIQGAQRRPWGR